MLPALTNDYQLVACCKRGLVHDLCTPLESPSVLEFGMVYSTLRNPNSLSFRSIGFNNFKRRNRGPVQTFLTFNLFGLVTSEFSAVPAPPDAQFTCAD